MKSLFSSILTLFLTISVLLAQTDKKGLATPITVLTLETAQEDSLAGMQDPATISIPKSEPKPQLDNAAVVRYASTAKCFVSLINNGALVERVVCKDMQTGKTIEKSVREHGVLFDNLSLDQKYQLSAVANDGKKVVLTVINTNKRIQEPINTSEILYNKLAKWSISPDDIPLSQLLTNLQEVSYHERLAFFQQYLLEDKSLEDGLMEGAFPNTTGSAKMLSNCKCSFVINARGSVNGGFDEEGNAASIYGVTYGGTPFAPYSGGRFSGSWSQFSLSGAATYQQVWSQGKRMGHESTLFSVDNLNSGSPYFAKLRYNLLCIEYTELPKECGCSKDIDLEFAYDTKLMTQTGTTPCTWCGSEGSFSVAEDQSIITVQKARTQELQVLGANRFQHKVERRFTINTQFFLNFVDLAAKIAPIIIANSSSSGGSFTLTPTQITGLSDVIKRIITTSASTTTGSGGPDEKVVRLLNGRRMITLEPNNPLDITMFSFPAVQSGGFTAWKGTARTFSRYSMSTVLSGAAPREGMEFCCSRPVAMWVSGFLPNWPAPHPTIAEHIRSAWVETVSPSVRSDYGHIIGNLSKTCKGDIDINPIILPPGGSNVNVKVDKTWVEQKSDGLYYQTDPLIENYHYVVYDVSGKILNHGTGATSGLKILDYTEKTLSTGIYIVHIYVNGVNQIFKIFKP